ncbi:protein transporter tim9 [Basidiobolus ranarum]|uniref:Mitochondrial import inner membrane translocase subunit n=1 Tax=Basidiobolus ranarum TaxID=34480 RepID=A0ABR2WNI3_9FUNG
MDTSQFSSAESTYMEQLVAKKQMKDFTRMYTSLVQRCYNDCNEDPLKPLDFGEDSCVNRCISKFIKHSERVGQRFAEQNALLTQQLENQ